MLYLTPHMLTSGISQEYRLKQSHPCLLYSKCSKGPNFPTVVSSVTALEDEVPSELSEQSTAV